MAALVAPRALRWTIAVLLFVGCFVLCASALVDEPLSGDEWPWMVQATNVWQLVRSGRFHDPFWSESHLLWGYASPPVSKWLIGFGMAAVGHGDPKVVTPPFFVAPGREWTPPSEAVRAGRLSSVVLGGLAVSTLFLFLSRDLPLRVAVSAALLLETSPIWLGVSRRALTDIHGVGMSLLLLPLYASAREATFAKRARVASLPWWIAVGVVAGLSVGCKFSAVGCALGLAVLLLVEGFCRAGDDRRRFRNVPAALTAALLCCGVAVCVFVLTYPYLWPDPVGRLRGIVMAWRGVRELHVATQLGSFAGSVRPGPLSWSRAVDLLILPDGWLAWALLPALLGALWLRWKSPSADAARVVAWALASPVLLAGAFVGGCMQSWILWAGIAGAALATIAVRGGLRRVGSTASLLILTAAAAGAATIVLLTTYISWQRYYVPLFPAMAVAAAVGIDDLRRSVAAVAGRAAARCVDAALVAGMLSVLSAFPRITRAKMGAVAAQDLGAVPAWLQGIAAACLTLALLAGLRSLARGRPLARGDAVSIAPR